MLSLSVSDFTVFSLQIHDLKQNFIMNSNRIKNIILVHSSVQGAYKIFPLGEGVGRARKYLQTINITDTEGGGG